jgi:hypothetical protein
VNIKIDCGEAGIVEVRRMGRAEMRTMYDSMAREAAPSDVAQNTWAQCAVSPSADELDSFIADFDGLPPIVLAELAKAGGYEMGAEGYPVVPYLETELAPEVVAKIKEATRRKPLGFLTPAGIWWLRPSGGTQAFLDEQARFASGKKDASRYEALRSLVIARAIHPSAEVVAASIEEHPGIPIVLEDALVASATTGGKAPARL